MILVGVFISEVSSSWFKKEYDLFNPFFSAFISATLFPLGSEALLIYDIKEGYNIYFF